MGHVRGLEKYEWVTWKVKIRLSIVYGKRVWWLLGGGAWLVVFSGSG